MKIIDFDRKFFEYARGWIARHPGLTDEQVEDSYNEIMQAWISQPADWLDGARPDEYFERMGDADALIDLMEGYSAAGVNLPEPLYSRIVSLGKACAPRLRNIVSDGARPEALRAEAMGMLRDMGDAGLDPILVAMVCGARERSELSDLAADILSQGDGASVPALLAAFDAAPEYAQDLMLDVLCNFPGDGRIYDALMRRLRNRPDERALWASRLNKLGDPRAIEPMQRMLRLTDLRYLDYIELRDAVEALGGDAGEERAFYGDPDFEALRNL